MRRLKTALSAALFGFGVFSLDSFDLGSGVSVSAQTVGAVNLVKVWAYACASGAANWVFHGIERSFSGWEPMVVLQWAQDEVDLRSNRRFTHSTEDLPHPEPIEGLSG